MSRAKELLFCPHVKSGMVSAKRRVHLGKDAIDVCGECWAGIVEMVNAEEARRMEEKGLSE